jgi:hypothetical protein
MSSKGAHFDLDRVKKNFDRAIDPAPTDLRTEAAMPDEAPPPDPYVTARAILERLRAHAHARLADHEGALAPLVDRVETLVAALERAKSADEKEREPLRKELLAARQDLEDLFEVFTGVGR